MAYYQTAPQPYGEPPIDWPHYGIGFGAAIRRYFKKYATFRGRASRGEYWWIVLLNALALVVYSVLLQAAGGIGPGAVGATPAANLVLNFFRLLFLAILVPNIAVQVRRLHDAGRRGWWSLLNLLPLFGWIALVILCLADTSPTAGRYGPPVDPQPTQDGWGQGYQTGPGYSPSAGAQGYGLPAQPLQPGPYDALPGAGGPPQGYGAAPTYDTSDPGIGTPSRPGTAPAAYGARSAYGTSPSYGSSPAPEGQQAGPDVPATPAPSTSADDAQPTPEGGPRPS